MNRRHYFAPGVIEGVRRPGVLRRLWRKARRHARRALALLGVRYL
jgi:hypothetical protein